MKNTIFILLMLLSLNSFAQKTTTTYFDTNGNIVDSEKTAATFKVITKENHTTYLVRFYQNHGPMIKQESYKDAGLSIKDGIFAWYNENGNYDSIFFYRNNKLIHVWNNNKAEFVNNIIMNNSVVEDTIVAKAVILNHYVYVEVKPSFYGGDEAWYQYLQKKLNFKIGVLVPQYKKITNDVASVIVAFFTNRVGKITKVYVEKSAGYPFDTEAMRVIRNSPSWRPEIINGKTVLYKQKQGVEFPKM